MKNWRQGSKNTLHSKENNPERNSISQESETIQWLERVLSQNRVDISERNYENKKIIALINGLRENNTVTHLDISYVKMDMASSISFGEMLLLNRSLVKVDLSGNKLEIQAMTSLSNALKKNPCLQNLSITNCHIKEAGFKLLAESLESNNTLLALNISDNPDLSRSIRYFWQLLFVNRTLEKFYCFGFELTEKDLISILDILDCNKSLNDLGISRKDDDDASWNRKEKLRRLRFLNSIDFGLEKNRFGKMLAPIQEQLRAQEETIMRLQDQLSLSNQSVDKDKPSSKPSLRAWKQGLLSQNQTQILDTLIVSTVLKKWKHEGNINTEISEFLDEKRRLLESILGKIEEEEERRMITKMLKEWKEEELMSQDLMLALDQEITHIFHSVQNQQAHPVLRNRSWVSSSNHK